MKIYHRLMALVTVELFRSFRVGCFDASFILALSCAFASFLFVIRHGG